MKKILVLGAALSLFTQMSYAGNPDRKGEAGALELNINGYARSAGFWDLNVAGVKGMEAERLNPAGVGYTQNTEINAAYTSWLTGSGVNIVQGGFATRFKGNAIALSINSLNFGAIDKTTTANPEGGIGVFKPTFLNIGLTFAKNFSLGTTSKMGDNLITGGVTLRLVSEIVGNVTATGFAFDAGLQYTTGKQENLHFGVSLRNVGTTMKFNGDNLAYVGVAEAGAYAVTYNKRTNAFELPTQLNMGLSYDLYFGKGIEVDARKFTKFYRLTLLGQYTANAFGNDNWGLGAEFALREMFMVRAAYRFENGIFKGETSSTAYNGFAAGMTINVPLKKKTEGTVPPAIAMDYGFRMTSSAYNFAHTHTVGLRINVGGAEKAKILSDKADVAPSAYGESKETPTATKKKGKKGKMSVEDLELEQKNAAIDSLTKANKELQTKANRVDTVIKKEVVIKRDTIVVSLEKSDYVGGQVDTVTKGGKKVLQFNDYEALEYETGSDKINPKSFNYLNYLVNIMKKNPGYKAIFEGHTDNVGAEDANQKLSEDRVESVKQYFVSKGIDGGRIATKAFGSKRPKYQNDTAKGRAKNRRVEIFMEM